MNTIALLLLLISPALADIIDAASVDRLVLERNDHVRSAARSLEASQARTGHLFRSFLPRLTVGAGAESFQTGPYTPQAEPFGEVSAKINLFRSGRDAIEERIRTQNVDVARSEAEDLILEELTKARQSYWTLIYYRELALVLQDSLARNEDALAAANRRLSAGMGSETDRIDFEINRTNLTQDLARTQLLERNTRRELSVLLGFEAATELKTPDQLAHDHDDSILRIEFDPERHREIRMLSAKKEVALLTAAQERRWWTPSLDAYGGYFQFTFRERDYFIFQDRADAVVGAKLTLELFDGGVARSEARSADHEAQALEFKVAQNKRELRAKVQTETDGLRLTHELLHGAEKNVSQAKAYLNGTLSEYRRGIKNSPDAFNANLRFLDARRRLADLRRDYQLARTEIQSVLGQMNEK